MATFSELRAQSRSLEASTETALAEYSQLSTVAGAEGQEQSLKKIVEDVLNEVRSSYLKVAKSLDHATIPLPRRRIFGP